MKKKELFLFVVLLMYFKSNAQLNLIPLPNSVQVKQGKLNLKNGFNLVIDTKSEALVKLYTSFFKGYKSQKNSSNVIVSEVGLSNKDAEEYSIEITPNKILVKAGQKGLFYAFQTLKQLLTLNADLNGGVSCVAIKDAPRFAHRGFMLDVARHFYTIDEVKEILDVMAVLKLNTFHWHLSDTQGWRIEIKKYPKLTEIGAWRNTDVVGHYQTLANNELHGGFYTQDEIKNIVKYASERFITIIPEIDVPGHSGAALRAYPEHRVTLPKNVKFSYSSNILFSPRESSLAFICDILGEIADLFPSKYIHIGGDEVNTNPWAQSPEVVEIMKANHLTDVRAVEGYMINKIADFLAKKDRYIIGWGEIASGKIPDKAKIMVWKEDSKVLDFARLGTDLIMSPNNYGMYFDRGQSISFEEPRNFSEITLDIAVLKDTYNYNPISDEIPLEQRKNIYGVQANLWTEMVDTYPKVQYMIYPRMYALAEVAWTNYEKKNYSDFQLRLAPYLAQLDKNRKTYRVPESFEHTDTTIIARDKYKVELTAPFPNSKVFYTLSQENPSELSRLYTKPFYLDVPKNQTKFVKSYVVTPAGKTSIVSTIKIINPSLHKGIKADFTKNGLAYKVYSNEQPFKLLAEGEVVDFDIQKLAQKFKNSKIIFEGYVDIQKEGDYQIGVMSNKKITIKINNATVFDHLDKKYLSYKYEAVSLGKAKHKISIIIDGDHGRPKLAINSNFYSDRIDVLKATSFYIN